MDKKYKDVRVVDNTGKLILLYRGLTNISIKSTTIESYNPEDNTKVILVLPQDLRGLMILID